MKLNRAGLKCQEDWKQAHIKLPEFDLDRVKENTLKNPKWLHFGGGNIFRGFVAKAHQVILNEGVEDTGIIVAETFDFEVIEKVYHPYDNLSLLVSMSADGTFEKTVVGSIVESLTADQSKSEHMKRLTNIFESPSLQMVSFTITEKGYNIKDTSGNYMGVIDRDIKNGPENVLHVMSLMASLAHKRYLGGAHPVTFVSMDNCAHNGDKLKDSVVTIAKEWLKLGFVNAQFIAYLEDSSKVGFPVSMIDKITPRPSEEVKAALEKDGLEDMNVIITDKKSYMAPFVNAEVSEYLIIEEVFTNGRPKLENAGIIFTDRETVDKVERMKVTTCLNPLHTALAVTGCLMGFNKIADQMQDETMLKLVKKIGYDEGMKVVTDPKIIKPQAFLDEVVNERFKNPFIPDTPQRIATDTSQKVGIRFGETIKAYAADKNLDPRTLTGIPLAIAAWCRYIIAIDDSGKAFEVSPDPMMEMLSNILSGVKIGDKRSRVSEILMNDKIFGVNLYEVGLGDKIEAYFYEMLAEKGAVRATLNKYL